MKQQQPILTRTLLRCLLVGAILVAVLLAGSLWTPYPWEFVRGMWGKPQVVERVVKVPVEKIVERIVEVPAPQKETENFLEQQPWKPEQLIDPTPIQLPPFPPVLPEKLNTGTFEQFTALARGLHLRSVLNLKPGSTASRDRKERGAYALHLSMELLLPHAADGKELLHANPDLPHVLRGYEALMQTAHVSRWYNAMYLHKQNAVRRSLSSLAQPLDKHNFFDVDTILEITAPETQRRVLWLQADMDVVSDGSDGDRLPTMPDHILKSSNYQPTTSYRWRKKGDKPNPLLPGWEARLARLLKERPRRPAEIESVRHVIFDLKRYSYLLAQYDPFIVIPLTLKEGRDDTFRPRPGDYAVVIVGKKLYPAIVGDYGPRNKAGEASLRLVKIINPAARVNARPVSSLGVSYVIFPHTAEDTAGPINYDRLNTRCRELVDELGGIAEGAQFIEIKDLLTPPPPTTPKDSETQNPESDGKDKGDKPESNGKNSEQNAAEGAGRPDAHESGATPQKKKSPKPDASK